MVKTNSPISSPINRENIYKVDTVSRLQDFSLKTITGKNSQQPTATQLSRNEL